MSALGPFVAIGLLVGGTIAFCLMLAVAARAVDRLWDTLAPGDEQSDERRSPTAGESVRVRWRPTATVLRAVPVAILAAALVFALAWLAFMLGRVRELG